MRLICIVVLLLQTVFPSIEASESAIRLERQSGGTELKYSLIAEHVTHPLIGVGATIVLPAGLEFLRFEKGNFFEQNNNDQVTYLISPKSNNPQQIILGIATLGKGQSSGDGTIATIYLKASKERSYTSIKFENTVASGIEGGKRMNYEDIHWNSVDEILARTGPSLELGLLAFCLLITELIFTSKNRIFSKVTNLWYNEKNTKTQHYEIFSEKARCKSTAKRFSQEIRLAILGQFSDKSNHQEDTKQASTGAQTQPY